MKHFKVEMPAELTEEERAAIESLVHYPSLERAYAEDSEAKKIKRKMNESIVEFERIVRRGTKTEAEKAERILTAYRTTLGFMNELEMLRQNKSE